MGLGTHLSLEVGDSSSSRSSLKVGTSRAEGWKSGPSRVVEAEHRGTRGWVHRARQAKNGPKADLGCVAGGDSGHLRQGCHLLLLPGIHCPSPGSPTSIQLCS